MDKKNVSKKNMSKRIKKPPVDVVPSKKIAIKLVVIMIITFVLLALLIFRLFWLEVVKGAEFKEMAYKQQTINRIISPARGTIYDSTGKALAISSRVDTVTINPR